LEAELNARPIPELTFAASVGYLNAKYTELSAEVLAVGVDLDKKFTQIPKLTLNAQASYTVPLDSGAKIIISGDAAHKTTTHRSVQNFPELKTKPYWIFNSRVAFSDPSDKYEIAAFVTNISNEMYLKGGVDVRALGFVESYYNRPREWGLSVRARF
jgi:iron complex outermembrane receptor protein